MAHTDAQILAKTETEILAAYGGAESALSVFAELTYTDRPLTADERFTRDRLGAAFSDMRRLVERFDSIIA